MGKVKMTSEQLTQLKYYFLLNDFLTTAHANLVSAYGHVPGSEKEKLGKCINYIDVLIFDNNYQLNAIVELEDGGLE